MARRKVPERPSMAAQEAAFIHEHPARRTPILVSPQPMTDWDLLVQWLLHSLPNAAEFEASYRAAAAASAGRKRTGQKKSRPPNWEMKLAAVEHMRSMSPPIKLSDAPGSICVRVLAEFVTRWRREHAAPGGRIPPCPLNTAAELAGTFIKMARSAVAMETFEGS